MQPANDGKVVRVTAGGLDYFLEAKWVASVRKGSPAKADIAVYSLAERIGVEPQVTGEEAVVVLAPEAGGWALSVESCGAPVEVESVAVQESPSSFVQIGLGWVDGVVRAGGDLLPRIDPRRLHPGWVAPSRAVDSEKARRAARPAGQPRITVFDVGRQELRVAVSVLQLAEVLAEAPLAKVPGPRHLLGVCQWRGRAVPVVDLLTRAGLGRPEEAPAEQFLVMRGPGQPDPICVPAGSEVRVQPLPLPCSPDADPLPGTAGLWLGSFRTQGRRLLVLDVDRVLARS